MRFSALQRAEIAEIHTDRRRVPDDPAVSVLFNEPKLLKCSGVLRAVHRRNPRFSALQRAEIAEILLFRLRVIRSGRVFQCSSTSRNC